MKQLKFRAWDEADKRWQRGASNLMLDMSGNQYWQFGYDVNMISRDDKWIVEQWTGLLDKNGVEIYCGDIVKVGYLALTDHVKYGEEPWGSLPDGVKPNDISTERYRYEVKFDVSLLWKLDNDANHNPDVVGVEVIGNIHQDKHLLEQQ